MVRRKRAVIGNKLIESDAAKKIHTLRPANISGGITVSVMAEAAVY